MQDDSPEKKNRPLTSHHCGPRSDVRTAVRQDVAQILAESAATIGAISRLPWLPPRNRGSCSFAGVNDVLERDAWSH